MKYIGENSINDFLQLCFKYFNEKLVSGKTIKTIGDESILGEGKALDFFNSKEELWNTMNPPICIYTTSGASQNVQILYKKEYAESVEIVETGEMLDVSGRGALNYIFAEAGEHLVKIKFKKDVTNFKNCFYYCSSLTAIPEGLFVNNKSVTYFNSCFYRCSSLTGTTPKDSDGGELWERAGKPSYPSSISGVDCFYNCTKLDNYSSIPSAWK